tara:strand:+ start:219 stop:881 length:663 start_codon:yes stop_codon:yes gene_type:complete
LLSALPKGKKGGKVRDRWRDKKWIAIESPTSFGSEQIAQVPVFDPSGAIGRSVETTLFDILKQEPQQYQIKLRFKVNEVDGLHGRTILQSSEYSREYLRSLTRRGSSMVSFVNDYTTKDGYVIRAYLVVFSQGRINSSRKHAIRLISKSLLTDKASSMTYEQFAQQAVLGQLASEIYNQIKKISHLKHVGIRKTKVLRVGEPMKEESPPQEEATQDVAAA